VEERVKKFRERNAGAAKGHDVTKRYKSCNEGGEGDSTSTSLSESLEEGVQGEGEPSDLPRMPMEATAHPDVQVYSDVTGGRIPGGSQYQAVIEAARLVRNREKLDEAGLREYLTPYWLAWSSRKRQDGRPYYPGNITWLVEWALNGSCPAPGGTKAGEPARTTVASPEETRQMLAEKDEKIKQAVRMQEEVRAKMRGLARRMAGKEAQ
jgi:hypothetical protein